MDTDPTETQRRAAYNFAENEALEIVKCVDELDTSGINLPLKLRELIQWGGENNVQVLIMYSSDRIARSFKGLQEFFNLIENTGIIPRFVVDSLPEDLKELRDALFLQSFIAQFRHREHAKHLRKVKGNYPKNAAPTDNSDTDLDS
jgi:DNA invertase Pin-like site-specific DNA recombinase